MPWVKLDDGFPEHPKALAAGDDACWLYVAALCYCARNLTDGRIPAAQIARLTGQRNARKLADVLVAAGLFEKTDDGYEIHDYIEYQPTKARVEKQRVTTANRVRKHRSNAVTSPEVTPPPQAPARTRGSGSGSGMGEVDDQGSSNVARAQADGTLHPKLAEAVEILEAARRPDGGGLIVEPLSIESMIRAHQGKDPVRAAHETAAIVQAGNNRTSNATSLYGSVLGRQQSNVRELPTKRLEHSRDLSRFDHL